jgi:hypothetical protein
MKILGLVLLAAVFVTGCTSSEHATTVLANQGYTHIEITGWKPFSCDKNDTFATGFRAMSPSGKEVTGVVCEGWLKDATIRFE